MRFALSTEGRFGHGSCRFREGCTGAREGICWIRKHCRANVSVSLFSWIISQLLQFLGETFDALVAMQYRLEDMEIDALLPTLLEKSGQAKERFRVAFRGLLASIPPLCPYAKYSPLLLQVSLTPCHQFCVWDMFV